MIAVALKGLAGRKVRALLTAFAVVIGVSMVSGTFVLTDTMQKAFDGIFAASYENTDAVVTGKEVVSGTTSAPVPGAARGRGSRWHDRQRRLVEGRDHRPRRQAAQPRRRSRPGAQLRPGAAAVQPAQAQVGRLAQELGRDRHRHGDRHR
jgi:MacB-like periplasmic core domain